LVIRKTQVWRFGGSQLAGPVQVWPRTRWRVRPRSVAGLFPRPPAASQQVGSSITSYSAGSKACTWVASPRLTGIASATTCRNRSRSYIYAVGRRGHLPEWLIERFPIEYRRKRWFVEYPNVVGQGRQARASAGGNGYRWRAWTCRNSYRVSAGVLVWMASFYWKPGSCSRVSLKALGQLKNERLMSSGCPRIPIPQPRLCLLTPSYALGFKAA